MQTLNADIANLYSGTVRVRVCGICIHESKILLVNHALYGRDEAFWSPPGGGVQVGETAVQGLVREFYEETGLQAEVGELLFINEHISPPLHAIELFFEVKSFSGRVAIGHDPELSAERQIIRDVRFMSWNEIEAFLPEQRHRILNISGSLAGIFKLNKYITADRHH